MIGQSCEKKINEGDAFLELREQVLDSCSLGDLARLSPQTLCGAASADALPQFGLEVEILRKKYGMLPGDRTRIAGISEDFGGTWLLENGKEVVKAHEGIGWRWADPGPPDRAGMPAGSCTVIDVCAGKGFASLLLASSLGNVLGKASVGRIIMVDLASGHDAPRLEYLDAVREQSTSFSVPIEFEQLDVHTRGFEEFVRSLGMPVVLLGVHLCRRLSSRCIEVFNSCDGVRGLVLLPCCLPIKMSPAFSLNGVRIDPLQLHACRWPFSSWVDALMQGVDATKKRLVSSAIQQKDPQRQ